MPPPTNLQMTPDGAQYDVEEPAPDGDTYEKIEILILDGGAFTVNCYRDGSDQPETIEAASLQELVPILASKLGTGAPAAAPPGAAMAAGPRGAAVAVSPAVNPAARAQAMAAAARQQGGMR